MNNLLIKQCEELIKNESEEISILSNLSALLNMCLEDISWVGFYLYKDNRLILGPFQGKIACSKIDLGKGVCGNCAKDLTTYMVDNVHTFKGHIACDSASNSEIVVPILVNNNLYGVLDIDSTSFCRFKQEDKETLEACTKVLEEYLENIL